MKKNTFRCCICGKTFIGFGNNPWPVNKKEGAKCCDACNGQYVFPARLSQMYLNKEGEEKDGK